MVSNISSLLMRGTLSALRLVVAGLIPSLLNATNFMSMSFSRCRACFRVSEIMIDQKFACEYYKYKSLEVCDDTYYKNKELFKV